jgi:hypothetical protein
VSNLVVRGYGFRRTGVVNRPQHELISPLEVDVIPLSVLQAELVETDVFEVEVELLKDLGVEMEFTGMFDTEVQAKDTIEGKES